VARVDSPLLNNLEITFFDQLIFDTPLLIQFISRTPMLRSHDEARVFFSSLDASVTLPQVVDGKVDGRKFHLEISCRESGWQLSSLEQLEQVCSSSFPRDLIFPVEHLHIVEFGLHNWQDYVESSQRLELLHPFSLWSVSTYLRICYHISRPSCKTSAGKEWQKCYPPCRLISWRNNTYSCSLRDLSRNPLGSLLPQDNLPVTQLPCLA
jgi:hypothetical protein